MKIQVTDWTDLSCDSEPDTKDFRERLMKGALISVEICDISTSCNISLFSSKYVDSESEIIYGEADTALDRGLQLALSILKDGDRSTVEISIDGKFVHKSLENSIVNFNCSVKLNILSNGKEAYELSVREKFDLGRQCKVKGTNLLTSVIPVDENNKYPSQVSAFDLFTKCVKWLSLIDRKALQDTEFDNDVEINELQQQCYNNLIYLHLAFCNFEKAVEMASNILEMCSTNIKALYRRSVANTHLQNYEFATEDLKEIFKINPTNKDAQNQMKIIKEKQKVIDQELAKAMKKFIFS